MFFFFIHIFVYTDSHVLELQKSCKMKHESGQKVIFFSNYYMKWLLEIPDNQMDAQLQVSNDPADKPFQNSVGKRENACNERFLLFPRCFLFHQKQKSAFE